MAEGIVPGGRGTGVQFAVLGGPGTEIWFFGRAVLGRGGYASFMTTSLPWAMGQDAGCGWAVCVAAGADFKGAGLKATLA
jgi:hypothetical protein